MSTDDLEHLILEMSKKPRYFCRVYDGKDNAMLWWEVYGDLAEEAK